MITEHRYVIAVADLAASAAYYSTVLGFEVREIGDASWRFFARDSCIIMAGECPDALPAAAISTTAAASPSARVKNGENLFGNGFANKRTSNERQVLLPETASQA